MQGTLSLSDRTPGGDTMASLRKERRRRFCDNIGRAHGALMLRVARHGTARHGTARHGTALARHGTALARHACLLTGAYAV
jgi:hypothetical protein